MVFLELGKATYKPNPISGRERSLDFFQHIIDGMRRNHFFAEKIIAMDA